MLHIKESVDYTEIKTVSFGKYTQKIEIYELTGVWNFDVLYSDHCQAS